ncbi:MAG: hypothetical protein Q8S20_15670, partial [Sulfuritalea sp.]|nr:hypothetical protein [Sulfuritalea sp.]
LHRPDGGSIIEGAYLEGCEMKTLFHHELCSREFGTAVLHVPTLLAWAKSKGLVFPVDSLLADLDYVQAEALIAVVANSCGGLSDRDAVGRLAAAPDLVRKSIADQALAADIIADPSADYARGVLGAEASHQWRKVLDHAIDGHELVLRDPHSLLPVDAPAPAKVVAGDAADGGDDWQTKCRQIADELHAKDIDIGAWSSVSDIADRVAPIADERAIRGPNGKLTAGNILREALQGKKWNTGRNKR